MASAKCANPSTLPVGGSNRCTLRTQRTTAFGYRPEGEYYLRYAGRTEAVGNDPYVALDRFEQRKTELRSAARPDLPTNQTQAIERKSARVVTLDAAIAEYLTTGKAAEKNWGKHTRQTYTLGLGLFRESCGKTHLHDVDGDDLRRFKVFLRKQQTQTKTVKKRIDDRTVWNHFNNVVGFLNSYGMRDLIPQSEWPTYEEKIPEAYDPEDVMRLLQFADEDERDPDAWVNTDGRRIERQRIILPGQEQKAFKDREWGKVYRAYDQFGFINQAESLDKAKRYCVP